MDDDRKDVGTMGVARNATVAVCSDSGEPIGQGLLIGDGSGGAVVLTCHHVATAVPGHKLHVALVGPGGRLASPIRATYDHPRSRPRADLALLRVEVVAPEHPLLHALDPERYDGGLPRRVVGFTYLSPWTFDAHLGTAGPLRCPVPEHSRADVGDGDYEIEWAFRLVEATDTREGISGAPVVGDRGVLGLAHFARDASAQGRPEAYMIPLTAWTETWPELAGLIEPFVDEPLRDAARVRRARDLQVGIATPSRPDPDLTVAGYRPDVYVPHPVADRAASSLERFDEVLIIGRPMSGKTRLAHELLRDRPEALVVIPEAEVPRDRIELAGIAGLEIVLLCDDVHLSAGAINVLQWRRRLSQGGGRVRAILTCRDGDDWRRVVRQDAALADRFRESAVLLSADGSRGYDFPADGSQELAAQMGLSDEALRERFDGTPGSLTLDLAAMRERYERLRETELQGVPASRLPDSIKLLHRAGQSPIREGRVREVVETVRGDGAVAEDTWEALRRRTATAGFGTFADGAFKGYPPLIEHCVDYEPNAEAYAALASLFRADGAWDELLRLAGTEEVSESVREEAMQWTIAEASGDPVLVARMLLAVRRAELGEEEQVVEELRGVIDEGDSYRAAQAANVLGMLYERWGRLEEAASCWQGVIDGGHEKFAPEAASRLGLLRAEEGRAEAAAAAYRMAVDFGQSEVMGVAAYNLAALQTGLDPEEELRLLRIAVDSGHESVAPIAAARLAMKSMDEEEATHLFRLATRSENPEVARVATLHLGSAQIAGDDLEAAKRSLRPIAESGETDFAATAAWLLGTALSRCGETEEALRMLRLAHASGDDEYAPRAAGMIGELLGETGDLDGAAEMLAEVVTAPGAMGGVATMNLGVVEWRRGNRQEALRLLHLATECGDETLRERALVTESVMRAWEDRGQDGAEEAISLLRSLIDEAKDEEVVVEAAHGLSQLLAYSGRFNEAVEVLRRASSGTVDQVAGVLLELGEMELRRGNGDLAAEHFQKVLSRFGENPRHAEEAKIAALRLGTMALQRGEWEAALSPLRLASDSETEAVRNEARMRLGAALCTTGAVREGYGLLQAVSESEDERCAPMAASFLAVELAEREGDWVGAAEAWHRVVGFEGSPLRARACRNLGWAYMNSGRTDAAIEALEEAARSADPEIAPDAAQLLSGILQEQGDPDRAAAVLRVAIGEGETVAAREATVELGGVEALRGNPEEAVRLWRTVVLDPLDLPAAVAVGNLALNAGRAGDDQEVEELLALLGRSDQTEAYLTVVGSLSEDYREAERLERAGAMLRRIVDSGHPEYAPPAAYQLGLRLVEAGKWVEAAEVLRVAVDSGREGPAESGALLLGIVNEQRGQREEACRFYELAMHSAHQPLAAAAALWLGEALVELGAGERAREAFSFALGAGTADTQAAAMCELASLLDEEGVTEEGEALWAEAMAVGEAAPKQAARAALMIGTRRIEREDSEGAEEALRMAMSCGDELVSASASINLAVLKFGLGQRDEAKELVQAVVDNHDSPLRARGWITLSGFSFEEDDLQAATRALETAVELQDAEYSFDAAVKLASVHVRSGRPDEAAEVFIALPAAVLARNAETVLGLATSLSRERAWLPMTRILETLVAISEGELLAFAMYAYAGGLAEQGRDEEAQRALELTIETGEARIVPAAALHLGKLYQREGRLEEAREAWELAAASGREDCAPEATYHLGLLRYDAGETAAAMEAWERAVESGHREAAPLAALNLGVLHHNEGRLEEAAKTWRRTIDSGHEEYGVEAERMLGLAAGNDEEADADSSSGSAD